MIELLRVKQASATWRVHGVELPLRQSEYYDCDTVHNMLEQYERILREREYRSCNAGLCDCFRFFGGVSFVKIGSVAFTGAFDEMFWYYTKQAVRHWKNADATARSKELGVHFVFEEMLRSRSNPIHYDYTYIFQHVPQSRRFQEMLEAEFAACWCTEIQSHMRDEQSLRDVVDRIGLLRTARYAARIETEYCEKYLRKIAADFTQRRERINLSKMVRAVLGREKTDSKLHSCLFDQMLRRITEEEFQRQYEKFPAENHRQTNVGLDEWIFYVQHGPSLWFNRLDFTLIHSPSLRLEVKYYLKHRFAGEIQIKDRFLTVIARGVNYLSAYDRRIHFFADIDETDVKALHLALEADKTTQNGKQRAFYGTIAVFSAMNVLMEYLMSEDRDRDMRSPIPKTNPFASFNFHNSHAFVKHATVIPERVMIEMDKHIYELSYEHRLLYDLLSQTGMRTKEAVFLTADCLEPAPFDGVVYLRYIPYKILSARRRHGLEDHRRILISRTLANEVNEQIERTRELREQYGLPYLFIKKNHHRQASMINSQYFLVTLDKMARQYDLRDDDGHIWHFTARQYRKTLAVTMIENGCSIQELAYLLGHMNPATTAIFYAEIREKKLSEMNTAFFKSKFELLLSKEQLERFTEEERRALYIDFCLENRRVEFGYCLSKLSEGPCDSRNSLINCANCKNLCTGKRYLEYWRQLHDSQKGRVDALTRTYYDNGIPDYDGLPEYRQATALLSAYASVVEAIEKEGA